METYEILELLIEKCYSDEENWEDFFYANFNTQDQNEWEYKLTDMDAGELRDFYSDRYFNGFYD